MEFAWYVVDRLKEKSTWAALGMVFTGVGVSVQPDLWQNIMLIGMGGAGVVAAFLPARVPASGTVSDSVNKSA